MDNEDLTLYKLSPRLVASDVEGETVILDFAKGRYFGLEEVGSFVWRLLEKGPVALAALCEAVTGEYEVSPEQCREDLRLLLQELARQGLVEETSGK